MAIKRADRARQFMPFAALTGYYEIINERKRVNEPRREVSEEEAQVLSQKLICVNKGDMITLEFYNEYHYEDITGLVTNIDFVYRFLTIVKKRIYFDDIYDIKKGEGAKENSIFIGFENSNKIGE